MKIRLILSAALTACALTGMAQTHLEGEEYYKADQLANAKELLLRNLNNAGTDKAISDYYLGLIALDGGDKADAAKWFNDGIAANPAYGFNYVGLGAIDLKNGDKAAAEKQFKMAESQTKKSADLQVAIARAYYEADPAAYAKDIEKRIEKARKINMNAASLYIFEGDVKKDNKDIGGAAAKYEMAANTNKDATEAYVKYAKLYTMVNQQFGIDMLSQLLKQSPNSALAQRELANAYYNAKQYDKAAAEYQKYVNNPNHFKQDEDRYAFLLFYGGKFKEGYDYSSRLLQANPDNFTAQRYQFMNGAQLPELAEQLLPMAEALYAKHKANPDKNKFAAIDYTLISSELQNAGRPEEAIAVLKEGIAEMPDNASFSKTLAAIYVDSSDLASAADAYHDYLAKTEDPGYNDFVQQAIYAYYGGAQNIEKDPATSAKYMQMSTEYATKASEMAPNQYKPVKILGDIAIAQNPETIKTVAQPIYLKAVELLEASQDPSRYKADAKSMYTYLGNSYLEQGDVETAKTYYYKFLELDPDNEAVRNYVEKLK